MKTSATCISLRASPRISRIAPAALLALASSASHAQIASTSVTLYGFIDSSLRYQQTKAGNSLSVVDGAELGWAGSRWGLIGSEDLGGGMKAIFNLENGFSLDNGQLNQGGRLFGRTAYVGLSNSFGELTLGRQYNALYYAGSWLSDPTYVSSWSPSVNHQLNYAWDNAVVYTGRYSDFIGRLSYAAGEQASTQHGSMQAASLMYNGHPFGAAIAYGGINGSGQTTFTAGGYYEIGPVTAQLVHYHTRNEPYTGARSLITNGVGVIYVPVPAWELTAAYWRTTADGAVDNKFLAVARYSLSKRTKLYVEADTDRNPQSGRLSGGQAGMQYSF